MNTALEKTGHAAAIEVYGFDREKVDLIKRTIANGASDAELQLFLYTAQRCGLDPLARQIYWIKRGNKATIQTSIDGYRLIADRSGNYAPGRAPTFEERDGALISATAYVLKYVRGTWHEVAAVAYWDEYAQSYNGKLSDMWANKPRIMLAKCAESNALRRAFPAELSGLYTQEEMPEAEPTYLDTATGEVVTMPPVPIDIASRRVANPPTPIVMTKTPEQRRLQLWSALNDRVLESKMLGLKVQDAEQMQIDGTASDAEIIAMGKSLAEAISMRKEQLEDAEDERGAFTEVDDSELFPNGRPA